MSDTLTTIDLIEYLNLKAALAAARAELKSAYDGIALHGDSLETAIADRDRLASDLAEMIRAHDGVAAEVQRLAAELAALRSAAFAYLEQTANAIPPYSPTQSNQDVISTWFQDVRRAADALRAALSPEAKP